MMASVFSDIFFMLMWFTILLFCGGSMLFFSRYRLSRKRHAEIRARLGELRAPA